MLFVSVFLLTLAGISSLKDGDSFQVNIARWWPSKLVGGLIPLAMYYELVILYCCRWAEKAHMLFVSVFLLWPVYYELVILYCCRNIRLQTTIYSPEALRRHYNNAAFVYRYTSMLKR
ncbi:hypothetical protein BDB00DRAFT_285799 [Zychaea mexicana]|uniref:uncharacterized protein n=1 Tax=Zychaea mexicana TaxID=64656 RepID=UPI0022FF3443|nr:uncharacterized protein BDB00DRAFT_285799 [Zychaea mexicana]KAI9467988.1 hypothetical protein BDB00DRAFT_285799 [Zychaea mexicana]